MQEKKKEDLANETKTEMNCINSELLLARQTKPSVDVHHCSTQHNDDTANQLSIKNIKPKAKENCDDNPCKAIEDGEKICSVNRINTTLDVDEMVVPELYEVSSYSDIYDEIAKEHCEVRNELRGAVNLDPEKIVEEFSESLCPLENNENADKNNYEDICFSSCLEGSYSDVSLQPEVHLNVNVKECSENQLCKFDSTTCDPSDSVIFRPRYCYS